MIRRLDTQDPSFEGALHSLTRYESALDDSVQEAVRRIIADVRARGDAALLEYTARFDGATESSMAGLTIGPEGLRAALDGLDPSISGPLRSAAERIRRYHEHQLTQSWQYAEPDGTVLGQRVTALERVGIYVPGGKAAYPSSVLMNAIPARIAGVSELVMVTPVPRGERNPLVLAAASLAGVDRVFTIGGAQAVAALAYGTDAVPRVDKIVGPGNAYVAAAKRQVFGQVGIDMIAGPSEILIVADGSVPPDWMAMDLFSQAEHDELAQVLMLSPDPVYLDLVAASIARLLPDMPRKDVIESSLGSRGALIRTCDLDEACEIANRVAPEHLELAVEDPQAWLPKLRNAGAIFLGRWSSEAVGDYCAGPNHVLPTSGTARFSSPLGVYDFQKRTSLIGLTAEGARRLGGLAATLARGEGLEAHARSAEYREKEAG